MVGKAPACCERLAKQLSLDSIEENMGDISVQEKMELIKGLVSIVDGFTRTVNMTSVGGSANAGAMVMNMSKPIADPETNFVIIDQSVTGMFERRTRIGL